MAYLYAATINRFRGFSTHDQPRRHKHWTRQTWKIPVAEPIERGHGGIDQIPKVHTFESTTTGAKQTVTFPADADRLVKLEKVPAGFDVHVTTPPKTRDKRFQ